MKLSFDKNLFFILLVAAALLLFRLGDRPLRNPDEGRYAEIAREMVLSGDWSKPTLYGVDYLSKPILIYWLLAGSFTLFGMSEWAARLVPAVFAWLGIWTAFAFARRYGGEPTARTAGWMLAANVFYLTLGRYLLIDSVFAFFVTSAWYAFYAGWRERRAGFRLLLYACAALAFLAKGMAGLVVPGAAILAYLAWNRRLREGILWTLSPAGAAVFLAIAAPWFVVIARREPDFLRNFFWHEHVARFLSKNFEHQEGWYFYLALLPAVFFPWSLFFKPFLRLSKALRRPEADAERFLWIACAATVAFYSLSRSKLATYLLPVLPPGTILLAGAWQSWLKGPDRAEKSSIPAMAAAAVMALAALLFAVSPFLGLTWIDRIPAASRTPVFWGTALVGTAGAVWLAALAARRKRALLGSAIVLSACASLVTARIMESANRNYTTRHLAAELRPRLAAADEVYLVGQPGAFYDFAFNLGRPARLVGFEGELETAKTGAEPREHERRAVVDPEDWKRLAPGRSAYSLMRASDYAGLDAALRARLEVVVRDERKVVTRGLGGSVPEA